MTDPAQLAHYGLRIPWMMEVSDLLKECGLLPAEAMPRTQEELRAALLEDRAVLLVGDEGEQLVVDRAQLSPGTREGHWLRADVQDDVLVSTRSMRRGRRA